MSVIGKDGLKRILSRVDRDPFWEIVHERYGKDSLPRQKKLAMLALRENAGWDPDQIAKAFQLPRRQVSRSLREIKQLLRNDLNLSPERQNHQVAQPEWPRNDSNAQKDDDSQPRSDSSSPAQPSLHHTRHERTKHRHTKTDPRSTHS